MSEKQSVPANPPPPLNGKRLAKLNHPLFLWPAAAALAVLLFFGLDYLVAALTHETTDDAFITAHVVSLAPRVAGQVAAVHAQDNQMVRSNELLVEIDPAKYAATAAQKEAAATAQDANYKAFLAGFELMQTKVTTAEAVAKQAQSAAEAAEAAAAKAEADFARATNLIRQKTISDQEYDRFKEANTAAEANGNSARQEAAAAASRVAEARATVTATEAAIAMALAQWQEAQTDAASAQLDLSYAKIFAPGDGRVTRKVVEAGDYVQVGEQLMSIVPTNVWVVANFKESQLKKMRINQPALVEIDALGGRKFRAHVDSVQAGSGAAFSLLPPENATGNFVKVVQRVPVKIIFDEPLPADHTLGPGLSVTPSVRVSRVEMPDWAVAVLALVLAGAAKFVFQFVARRQVDQTTAK